MQPAPRREAFFSALTNSYPPLEARRAKTLPRKPAVRGCCTPWCLPGGRDRLVTLCVARPAGSQALATSNSVGHGRPGIAGHSRRGHRRARNALPQLRRPATIPALRVSSNGRPPPITRSPISFNSSGPPPPTHTHTPLATHCAVHVAWPVFIPRLHPVLPSSRTRISPASDSDPTRLMWQGGVHGTQAMESWWEGGPRRRLR